MRTVEFDRLPTEGARVLDAGCGEGRHAVAAGLADAAEVVGLDLDPERLATAREGYREYAGTERTETAPGRFLQGDARSLPFPDDAFDVVVCAEVLEHVPDMGSTLDELRRVCRPNGHLAVSVPRAGPEQVCWALSTGYHEVDGGHVRVVDRNRLRESLATRGFREVGHHFAHALHSPYWWLKCLWWDREPDPLVLRAYERFLEWDTVADPEPVRALETALDPLVGKSEVFYFRHE